MSKNWIPAAIIASVVLVIVSGILLIHSLTNQLLEPINNISQQIGTQAAKILHPSPTVIPDPVTIINEVRQFARLETIQYSVEKIITAETGQEIFGALFGDRLLFVAHGTVIAGVDLSKLNAENLQINNGVLEIDLPNAEVFISTLNNDKSYVYDRDTGIFKRPDENLETLARQAAEDEIRNAALNDGILKQAQINAEVFLERFLSDLGFEQVIFT